MSERTPEQPTMTEAQTEALRNLCERYDVEFNPEHYTPQFDLPDGYVAGWIGGPKYANPERRHPSMDYEAKSTIYVGCDPEGRISS